MTEILSSLDNKVLSLRLNRPARKNALTAAMYATLADALLTAADDAAVRVVLISGEAGVFTSGNDLADFQAQGANAAARDENAPVLRFLRAVSTFPKPLVAAVEGPAIGIGTTLLLHCDLVYAASDARFALPFVNLGLVPEAASSLLLPRMAGWHRAAELLMLGEPFDAEAARTAGIVNTVVEPGAALARAGEAAAKLAVKAPEALRLTKRLMKDAERDVIAQALGREFHVFGERLASAEAKEAFAAFFEKRKPDFSKF